MTSFDATTPGEALAAERSRRSPEGTVPRVAQLRPSKMARVVSLGLTREAPLIMILASMVALWTVQPWLQFAPDTWLNLVGGREILNHGLPYSDSLAILSQGRDWIDQQWLANLSYYGLYAAGGKTLLAFVNIGVYVGAVALAFVIARRRGASVAQTAMFGLPAAFLAPSFARAEVLVQPLFVLLLGLLASESRRKTRRIVLVFPILILWANLHGSVVMAAALVALLGFTELIVQLRLRHTSGKSLARAGLLMSISWACIFASPYGFHLVTYYRATLHNPMFARFMTEWAPPTATSLWGFILFSLAGVGLFLIARRPRLLTSFELGALAVTFAGAASAARSIDWFAYAAAILFPGLLHTTKARQRTQSERRLLATTAVLAVAVAAFTAAYTVTNPPTALATDERQGALDSVAQVLRADPNARIFAGYDVADWLFFRLPESRGRIAYDGRWEILPQSEMETLFGYLRQTTPAWERPSDGYRLIVLNPLNQRSVVRTYRSRPSLRLLYENRDVIVFDRGPSAEAGSTTP